MQTLQLERDLQQVLDEKQELVTERDAYRHKHGRLNTELNYILKGDEKGVVDIDAVIMENKSVVGLLLCYKDGDSDCYHLLLVSCSPFLLTLSS